VGETEQAAIKLQKLRARVEDHLKAVAGRETESLKNIQTYTVQAWLDKDRAEKDERAFVALANSLVSCPRNRER